MEKEDLVETPVEMLRTNLRELEYQERRTHREKQVNSRRGILGEVSDLERIYTPHEVEALAKKLKNKNRSVTDYMHLSQATIQSEENIISFLKVSGALQALVRDVIGHSSLQLAAVNCCCNLALGDEKSCLLLTKAAAPYLLSNLDGLNNHLVEMSAWTLGNLAGCHEKPWSVLQSQGLLPKLLNLITSSHKNVAQSAIYALNHYVRTGTSSKNLKCDSLVSIVECVLPLMEREETSLWLVFRLSCFKDCDEVMLKRSVVSRSLNLLAQCKSSMEIDSNILKSTALVRILANFCAVSGAYELLHMDTTILISVLTVLLSSQYQHIQNETLWLIGNLLNHPAEEVKSLVQIKNLEILLGPLLAPILISKN